MWSLVQGVHVSFIMDGTWVVYHAGLGLEEIASSFTETEGSVCGESWTAWWCCCPSSVLCTLALRKSPGVTASFLPVHVHRKLALLQASPINSSVFPRRSSLLFLNINQIVKDHLLSGSHHCCSTTLLLSRPLCDLLVTNLKINFEFLSHMTSTVLFTVDHSLFLKTLFFFFCLWDSTFS